MEINTKTLLHALKLYYLEPQQVAFKQFRNGLIYFAVGFGTMMMAMVYMPSSAKQEWIVLFGLVVGAIGFTLAMFAQMRLIISRVLQFYWSTNSTTKKKPAQTDKQ